MHTKEIAHNSNIASVAHKVTVLQAISQAGTRDQNDILTASLPADGMMPLAKDAVVSVTCCGAPDSCNMFSRDRLLPSDDTHSDIMLQNSNNSKILQINFVQPHRLNMKTVICDDFLCMWNLHTWSYRWIGSACKTDTITLVKACKLEAIGLHQAWCHSKTPAIHTI